MMEYDDEILTAKIVMALAVISVTLTFVFLAWIAYAIFHLNDPSVIDVGDTFLYPVFVF